MSLADDSADSGDCRFSGIDQRAPERNTFHTSNGLLSVLLVSIVEQDPGDIWNEPRIGYAPGYNVRFTIIKQPNMLTFHFNDSML